MFADFRVHGLNKMGEAPPFSFPVIRCRPAVKALEKGHVQPMYAKVREHGAPVQPTRRVRKREIWRKTNAWGLPSVGARSRVFIRSGAEGPAVSFPQNPPHLWPQ